jgi:type IV pilus assembly protein PilB
MAGLASLDDLIKESQQRVATQSGMASVSDDSAASGLPQTVTEKFQRKMEDVALKEKEIEAQRFAQSIGAPHIDLEKFPISQEALKQIPFAMAKELQSVCFFVQDRELRVGSIDPTMPDVEQYIQELSQRLDAHVGVYVISQKSLLRVYELYSKLPVIEAVSKDIKISEEIIAQVQTDVTDFASLQAFLQKKNTTDIISIIMGAGVKLNASDVHIEAEEKQIVVRFRLDGILHDVAELPNEAYRAVISRLKLVAALKLNITDKPQDGRITLNLAGDEVDVRVSTIPTVYGESVVMRLLKQNREGLTLEKLGMHPSALKVFAEQIKRPNGMIITTGPTGSGKTTTLYAAMQVVNTQDVKIITLEDPVEYKMPGINQSQIDESKGYTFAKGLRSMVRQDPDIAMVGEIRDLETAEIAVQAALTGHLILSTIHTNSAAGAVPRFMSMGVKPFLLAPALNCVIGQRLVRRMCQSCKHEITLEPEVLARVESMLVDLPASEKPETLTFYAADGCAECNGIGYKGRVGIYEIFVVSKEVEGLILQGNASEYDVEDTAKKQGMITMVQDGLIKAAQGMTSVEEVFRVIE